MSSSRSRYYKSKLGNQNRKRQYEPPGQNVASGPDPLVVQMMAGGGGGETTEEDGGETSVKNGGGPIPATTPEYTSTVQQPLTQTITNPEELPGSSSGSDGSSNSNNMGENSHALPEAPVTNTSKPDLLKKEENLEMTPEEIKKQLQDIKDWKTSRLCSGFFANKVESPQPKGDGPVKPKKAKAAKKRSTVPFSFNFN
jgi:hypothetical protein